MMKFLWDKLLIENQVIMQLSYTTFPQTVYYLFPTMEKTQKFIDKSRNDDTIVQDSIKIKSVKDIFD